MTVNRSLSRREERVVQHVIEQLKQVNGKLQRKTFKPETLSDKFIEPSIMKLENMLKGYC
ncbi:hypothetical protein [Polynucleobacter sp.]|uniref:hypothetical protein n=1 Tax=Polynucleobacter sp. TaxID=2029855 RepID=UPI003F69E0D8